MLDRAIEDVEYELGIARHNLWVSQTEVATRQEEVSRLEEELKRLSSEYDKKHPLKVKCSFCGEELDVDKVKSHGNELHNHMVSFTVVSS